VAISSANIPAVSFVVTAIMPARGHQWNEAIDSSGPELPITSVKERDQTMAQFIPQPYCNSFAIARMNTEDVVEWHRLVTRVQHNQVESSLVSHLPNGSVGPRR
jgi:hypothetical protein